MNLENFSVVKSRVLKCLLNGDYQHEQRNHIDEKNLLATGEISEEQVISLIKSSNGTCHSKSPHHTKPSYVVHVLKHKGWYIKFYFLELECGELSVFISVHPSMP